MYKYFSIALLLFLLQSCMTQEVSFIGTTSSIVSTDRVENGEQWNNTLQLLLKSEKKVKPAILWTVGMFKDEGVKLNFPGITSQNISYSNVDFNKELLNYFDKNKINIFLNIEPGNSDIIKIINIVLNKYGGYKSVKGISINLEWLTSTEYITKDNIDQWVSEIHKFDKNYKLVLKHWSIDKIDNISNSDVYYIHNTEGIKTLEQLEQSFSLWNRRFYRSNIGLEIGSNAQLDFLLEYKNPITEVKNKLYPISNNISIFWDEETIFEYIDYLDTF